MNMNVRLILAAVFFAAVGMVHAADPEVEKLLAKMRQVYSSTKTAKVVVKMTGIRFGKDAVVTDLTYMKELKIHAKLTGPAFGNRSRTFISDGKRTSMDDFSGNVQLAQFDLDVIPVPINLEAMSFWDWKRQLSTSPGSNMERSKMKLSENVSWNGKKWTVLHETAHGQGVYVDYFIDPKSALIHRVMVYDLKKSELRFETVVVKLQRNVPVNSSLFKVKSSGSKGVRSVVEKRIKF